VAVGTAVGADENGHQELPQAATDPISRTAAAPAARRRARKIDGMG
jgi:hypothetical protein